MERDAIIDGSRVAAGDALIGLASSGPHSNGYSLVRKIVEVSGAELNHPFGDTTLGATLLAPTRIYVKPLLALMASLEVRALAHITGGGLPENLPRVLPPGCRAVIDAAGWSRPPIFDWLQEQGNVSDAEMYRTFNCGVGMVVCVAADDAERAIEQLNAAGERATRIGTIEPLAGEGDEAARVVIR